MPLIRTDSHDDLVTLNGFRFEVQGQQVAAITNIGGLNRNVGEIEWVDGGSGHTEFFSDQKKMHGPLTIVYRIDPSKGDFDLLRNFVTATIGLGTKFDFTIVKYHHGIEIFRIQVYKGLFREESWVDLDNNGSGPLDINLTVPCSFWEVVSSN